MGTLVTMNAAMAFTISAIFFSIFLITAIDGNQPTFGESLNPKLLGLMKERLTHFHLYFQDLASGPKATAVPIIQAPNNPTGIGFGFTVVIDDALTIHQELNSKLVGRAQGLYALASQTESAFIMAMNFVFLEGKYNGSTICILGRNLVFDKVREMPIIGGTGLFRFARGYVQARTHFFNTTSGDATVEYDIYVMHY
ncbi:hypothetical protein ACHQM5_018590 [Ranunculus cassubicifolius]